RCAALPCGDDRRRARQVPAEQLTVPDLPAGWPPAVDQVAEKLDEVQADRLAAVKTGTLQRLDGLVQSGRGKRQLRKLAAPDTLYVPPPRATPPHQNGPQPPGDHHYPPTPPPPHTSPPISH